MKGLLEGIAIWFWTVWWCVMNVSAVTKPSMILQEQPDDELSNHQLRFHEITLDLEDPTQENYRELLLELRTVLRADNLACGLPMLRGTASPEDRFVLVKLKITPTMEVTLAIDVHNLYVVAYQDKVGVVYRANFLSDAPEVAVTHLFRESLVWRLPFEGTYGDLVNQGGGKRETLPLGLYSLKAAANAVHGVHKPIRKDVAKFLIIAVQMVSEAARFKYITKEILRIQPYESVLPNPKVLRLENKWGPISEAIIRSRDCVDLWRAVELIDAHNNKWIINRVLDISADMGILNHLSPRVQVS